MAGLVSRLCQRDHRVTLITLDDGDADRHCVDGGVKRVALNLMRSSRGIWQKLANNKERLNAISQTVGSERPDVTLSFCDRTNISTLLATRRLGIPVVVSERSDPIKHRLNYWWHLARRRAYPLASRVVALTDTAAKHLQPMSRRPVVVIPSAVDFPDIVSDRDTASAERCVIGVGRLEYEKGFDRLIRAFDIATTKNPDWNLRIVGEGSMRDELEEIVRDLKLKSRVSLPGWINPIWPEVAAATVFALPSRYEGFPSALLEAMAAGVPSIAVDCESGPRAIIRHQKNGILVRNSVEELATGINRLINEDELRETIGQTGREVIQKFSWDKMVDAYETLLSEVAGRKL